MCPERFGREVLLSQGKASRSHTKHLHNYRSEPFNQTVRAGRPCSNPFEARRRPEEAPNGSPNRQQAPQSIEGMETLFLASGAHVIKTYIPFVYHS
jgi:hypothetical protein